MRSRSVCEGPGVGSIPINFRGAKSSRSVIPGWSTGQNRSLKFPDPQFAHLSFDAGPVIGRAFAPPDGIATECGACVRQLAGETHLGSYVTRLLAAPAEESATLSTEESPCQG